MFYKYFSIIFSQTISQSIDDEVIHHAYHAHSQVGYTHFKFDSQLESLNIRITEEVLASIHISNASGLANHAIFLSISGIAFLKALITKSGKQLFKLVKVNSGL